MVLQARTRWLGTGADAVPEVWEFTVVHFKECVPCGRVWPYSIKRKHASNLLYGEPSTFGIAPSKVGGGTEPGFG